MRLPARLHHPIAVLLLLAAGVLGACSAHAETVFRCRGADGGIAFQDRACAATQVQSEIAIAPPPPVAPLPADASRAKSRGPRAHGASARARASKPAAETLSFECLAANGERFYRHGACPKQIRAQAAAGSARKRGASEAQTYAVTAHAVPRGEVCREMQRAGSIGRAGHERDESVSTYERNLGRDPCRRF